MPNGDLSRLVEKELEKRGDYAGMEAGLMSKKKGVQRGLLADDGFEPVDGKGAMRNPVVRNCCSFCTSPILRWMIIIGTLLVALHLYGRAVGSGWAPEDRIKQLRADPQWTVSQPVPNPYEQPASPTTPASGVATVPTEGAAAAKQVDLNGPNAAPDATLVGDVTEDGQLATIPAVQAAGVPNDEPGDEHGEDLLKKVDQQGEKNSTASADEATAGTEEDKAAAEKAAGTQVPGESDAAQPPSADMTKPSEAENAAKNVTVSTGSSTTGRTKEKVVEHGDQTEKLPEATKGKSKGADVQESVPNPDVSGTNSTEEAKPTAKKGKVEGDEVLSDIQEAVKKNATEVGKPSPNTAHQDGMGSRSLDIRRPAAAASKKLEGGKSETPKAHEALSDVGDVGGPVAEEADPNPASTPEHGSASGAQDSQGPVKGASQGSL